MGIYAALRGSFPDVAGCTIYHACRDAWHRWSFEGPPAGQHRDPNPGADPGASPGADDPGTGHCEPR